VKLVCVADLHVHPYRLCSRDGGHDRLMDGLSVLRQSLDLARELEAVWVFAGDMKQPKRSWPQDALTGSLAVMREYEDVPKVMVEGNHDAKGEGGGGLAPFTDVATVVESACIVTPTEDVELVCAPWDADCATVRKLINARSVHTRLPLVAHGFLQGCALGPEDARIAKGTPLEEYGNFSVAVFGDVHKGQWRRPGMPYAGRHNVIECGPPTWLPYPMEERDGVKVREVGAWCGEVFYCGSTYQQNWGERNDPPKGALVVDLATGAVELWPLRSPRYHHLELDEDGLVTFVETSVRQAYEGGFVRVVYTGKPCAALDAARGLGDSGEFRSFQVIMRRAERSAARAELHAGMPMSEILRSYVAARPFSDDPCESARALEALTRLVAEL
jgi:hypothetical protein